MNTADSWTAEEHEGGKVLCFQQRTINLIIGVIGAVFFTLAWIISVAIALLNVGGDFGRPILAACFFTMALSPFVAVAGYGIAAYSEDRLFLNATHITKHGVLWNTSIPIQDVETVKWSIAPMGGIVVRSPEHKIKIDFNNLNRDERWQISEYFVDTIPRELHRDWDQSGWPIASLIQGTNFESIVIFGLSVGAFQFIYWWFVEGNIWFLPLAGSILCVIALRYAWRAYRARNTELSEELVERIVKLQRVFENCCSKSVEKWVREITRNRDPELEVASIEAAALTYVNLTNQFELTGAVKEQLFVELDQIRNRVANPFELEEKVSPELPTRRELTSMHFRAFIRKQRP